MSLETKELAGGAAGAANDAAAVLASGAAVVGVIAGWTGAGVGVAGVLGLGSALFWLVGNEYSDLAMDPPRKDYQLVSRYQTRPLKKNIFIMII